MTQLFKDKTEEFLDDNGESVQAFILDDGRISVDICGNVSCTYLSKEQASEFAKQLLDLCGPEYKI